MNPKYVLDVEIQTVRREIRKSRSALRALDKRVRAAEIARGKQNERHEKLIEREEQIIAKRNSIMMQQREFVALGRREALARAVREFKAKIKQQGDVGYESKNLA